VKTTGLTPPTVNAALADLERLGIVAEATGRRRGRAYAYRAHLDILGEGMTPLPV
jgi:Fic family protein